MHIFFSGIGGTAIGPLALIAHQAGYEVSGSDKQDSQYINYLRKNGINNIHIGQTSQNIEDTNSKNPIDWVVFSSAVLIENPNHPEITFAKLHGIKTSKRDELLNEIISKTNKKLLAIAGTHGKTTTTAMAIWLFKQINMPISYSVGAKIPFGDMGHYNQESQYFVYECDEFDRNFLAFKPAISIITGIDYDHHEIFPTRQDYQSAFKQFLDQSEQVIGWKDDFAQNNIGTQENYFVINESDPKIDELKIAGRVNRLDAWQIIQLVHKVTKKPIAELILKMEEFPGLSRRFEKIKENLYTDYAHTPPKIKGCLQMAQEISKNVVVVYEPLTDRRQHFIKNEYKDLFKGIKKLYWVPSYLAREDPNLEVLTPKDLISYMDNSEIAEPADMDNDLVANINHHLESGDLVVCMSGGGGGSLDEWLRGNFKA